MAATTTAKPETAEVFAFCASAAKTILEKYGFKFDQPGLTNACRDLADRMDGDPAIAGGVAIIATPARTSAPAVLAWLRRGDFLQKSPYFFRRASAAGAAAGQHGYRVAVDRQAASLVGGAAGWPEHLGIVFAFRWTGAALALRGGDVVCRRADPSS